MIQAFLFDYDGVMTSGVADSSPAKKLAHNLGVAEADAVRWILEIWDDYSTGKLNDDQAWSVIEQRYGTQISPSQRDIWSSWEELTPLPQMREFVRDLKNNGFTVGLVSNVIPPTAALVRKNGGYDDFDFVVLSYEVGAKKPDPGIYQAALAKLPSIQPENIMFLDDRKACVEGAKAVGMQALHVTNHQKTIDTIKDMS